MIELYELSNKFPNKIEFEVDYTVYHYDNFKFYLKHIEEKDEVTMWFHLQNTVKEWLYWKLKQE